MQPVDFIGPNIRYCRKSLRLSQESLANALSLNRGNIASYEKGVVKPSIKNLQAIASYFGFGLEEFINKDFASLLKPNEIIDLRQKNQRVKPSSSTQKNTNEELLKRYRKMRRIFEGLSSLHEYRRVEYEKLPRELQGLVFDYSQVLSLFEELLNMMGHTLNKSTYYLRNGMKNEIRNETPNN